nr:serine hydroxymethyltransferase [Synergistales bacterium]
MILPFDKDPEIEELIWREKQRQEDTLSLVASESLAPAIIRKIGDTILTNRTFEGYPGKRYYAGGMFFDQIETIAIERAKELFGAEHANVQPHCGANTNVSVY